MGVWEQRNLIGGGEGTEQLNKGGEGLWEQSNLIRGVGWGGGRAA